MTNFRRTAVEWIVRLAMLAAVRFAVGFAIDHHADIFPNLRGPTP